MAFTITAVGPCPGQQVDLRVAAGPDALPDDIARVIAQAVPWRSEGEARAVTVRTHDGWQRPARTGPSALRHGSVVGVGAPGAARSSGGLRPLPPLLELHVTGGPCAGRRFPLGPGRYRIGRAAGADVRLPDPLVSRRHALLEVTASGVTVGDLDSANGVWLDGTRIAGSRPVLTCSTLRLGRSTLRLRLAGDERIPVRDNGDGYRLVTPSSWPVPPLPEGEVRFPAEPPARGDRSWSWPAVLAPLAVSGVLAAVTHWWMLLAFALTSPVVAAALWWSDRRHGRASRRRELAAHRAAVEECEQQVRHAVDTELRHREALCPDLCRCLARCTGPARGLWSGRGTSGPLAVRLGTGTTLGSTRTVRRPGHGPETVTVHGPVLLRLDPGAVHGVTGPGHEVDGMVRAIVLQLAAALSPTALRISVIGEDPARLGRWLPHLDAGPASPRHLVVVPRWSRAEPQDADRMAQAVSDGAIVVCGEAHGAPLPARTGTTVVLGRDGTAILAADRDPAPGEPASASPRFDPDLLGAEPFDQASRSLAALRETTGSGDGWPAAVSAAELWPVTAEDLHEAWSRRPGTTSVPCGRTRTGVFSIDLARDGPHALVAGTTGAGKSELLQTLIGGLAAANRPDDLGLVLIDYKGGAAFSGLRALPHVLGLVTDLDGHLAARALRSLRAELRRRERLLGEAGARDLDEYRTRRHRGGSRRPPIARLVIVIDEYRMLAEDLPEFTTGLVRVAATGRSLGVHLIIATQRPAGALGPEVTAQLNLRIALRVRDAADSADVIDAPDAARLPLAPGRALARIGAEPLVEFQTARLLPVPRPDPAGVEVRALADAEARPGPAAPGAADHGWLVAAVARAARQLDVAPPPAPWLAPLPDRIPSPGPAEGAQPDPVRVPLALADLPDEQRQILWSWEPGQGSLALCGGPGSGRTTAVAGLAAALGRLSSEAVHLHVYDGQSALSDSGLRGHSLGSLVRRGQVGHWCALVRHLDRELELRATRPGPLTVLAIDGWEAALDELGRAWPEGADALHRILRDGPGLGVVCAVAGGRAVLSPRVWGTATHRVVLGAADPADLAVAGVPRDCVPERWPPGRGVLLVPALPACEAQLLDRPPGTVPETPSGRTASPASASGPVASRPWRVRDLPRVVTLAELGRASGPDSPAGRLVGVAGPTADPVEAGALGVRGAGTGLLVVGPAGSGRTNALTVLARALAADFAAVWWHGATPGGPAPGSAPDLEDGPVLVVVDDAHLLDPGFDETLAEWWRLGRVALLASASVTAAQSAYRGVLGALRQQPRGILLGPGEGREVFGLRSGRAGGPPDEPGGGLPGRGLLVAEGLAVPVQVALAGR